MKAIAITKINEISFIEQENIKLKSFEIKIAVRKVGICGSDLHIYHGNNPFVTYPRVIGHEIVGEVIEIGKEVNGFLIGDRIVVDPAISCGNCYACLNNRTNVCEKLEVIGVHREGGLKEFLCLPALNAYKINDLPYDVAVLIEPYSIAANILDRVNFQKNDTVLIFGSGVVGVTITQVVKMLGGTVIITDILDNKLELSKKVGADYTINSKKTNVVEYVNEITKGKGVSIAIDAVGLPYIMDEIFQVMSVAGRIGLLGLSKEKSKINCVEMIKKELSIHGSRLNNKKFDKVIEWLSSGKLLPGNLITHQFEFEDTFDAIKVIEDEQIHSCKVIINI